MMIRLYAIVVIGMMAAAVPAVAKEDKEGYETCILEHVPPSENAVATNLMTNACHRLFIDNFMLSDKDRAYFECQLQYLPVVKNDQAAFQVKATCNKRHRSLFN
ncbi:hypothetical protein ABT56_02955 [Photobacterium aquae]|uniref:Uncharacterized protein n=1 Tax=Photobacterium aquae TaxID=1195763 RepID=A0A0J1HBW7_9GAMM|nr:VF_A0006 family four-cysteine protein [Photobacterium aquae]KLV09168.1 hypothetical protein ABT56_02955 [Photobacterium aquae]